MAATGASQTVFLAFCCFIVLVRGTIIELVKTPNDVISGLTSTMTLRCTVNNTATGPLVGDAAQTPEEVGHLTSLIVTRASTAEQLARVTQFDQATALADLSNLKVTGDVSGTTGELGYIELTWEYPTQQQSGLYECEVNAIDTDGHNLILTSTLEIGITEPSLTEVVKIVRDLLEAKESSKNQIDQMTNDLSTLNSQASRCARPRHMETGEIRCGDSTKWSNDENGDWSNYVTVKFKNVYDKPPLVKIGLDNLDHDKNSNTRFFIGVDQVDVTGFTVKCGTWADSRIFSLGVSWLSISQ